MKIKIQPGTLTLDILKKRVSTQFPDYKIIDRNKKFFVVKKSNTEGANVVLKKNSVLVVGNFPTTGGQILFSLSIFLLGIIIPLIIYYVKFNKKLKKVETELGNFIKKSL
jgi:hypothetical protein